MDEHGRAGGDAALGADRYRLAFEHASHGLGITAVDGTLVEVNRRFAALLGYDEAGLLAMGSFQAITHPEDLGANLDLHAALLAQEIPQYTMDKRFLRSDGSDVWVRVTVTAVLDGTTVRYLIGHIEDMTDRHIVERRLSAQQELLEQQARHDALTGLANRVALRQELDRRLARAAHDGTRLPVMYLDIDRFKLVNDTLGHAAGDELLRKVADRLREVTRSTDLVARVSGDEFVVVLDGVTTPEVARSVCQRVIDAFEVPFRIGSRTVYSSTSVGLAFGEPGSTDAAELLADADVAMYAAKEAGRNRFAEFDERMRAQVSARHEIDTELRAALQREQLELHYQPVVRIDDGALVAAEALLRWRRPEVGLVGPELFVPVAEENGLIVPIGQWVVEEACRQAAEWRQRGLRLPIAVNVSARQLQVAGLATTVETALQRYHVSPDLLALEITESILVHDVEAAIAELDAVRSLGVSIALDDFGTRYSSLTYLCRLPIDIVKVDRTFTWQLLEDRQSRAVVRMLAGVARDAGWQIVAEGIESEAHLAAVAELGCAYAQGYLISGPVEGADLPGLAAAWPLRPELGPMRRAS